APVGRHIAHHDPVAVLARCRALHEKLGWVTMMAEAAGRVTAPAGAWSVVAGLAYSLYFDLAEFRHHPDFQARWLRLPRGWPTASYHGNPGPSPADLAAAGPVVPGPAYVISRPDGTVQAAGNARMAPRLEAVMRE